MGKIINQLTDELPKHIAEAKDRVPFPEKLVNSFVKLKDAEEFFEAKKKALDNALKLTDEAEQVKEFKTYYNTALDNRDLQMDVMEVNLKGTNKPTAEMGIELYNRVLDLMKYESKLADAKEELKEAKKLLDEYEPYLIAKKDLDEKNGLLHK